jgi:hypothetical protein
MEQNEATYLRDTLHRGCQKQQNIDGDGIRTYPKKWGYPKIDRLEWKIPQKKE